MGSVEGQTKMLTQRPEQGPELGPGGCGGTKMAGGLGGTQKTGGVRRWDSYGPVPLATLG